MNALSMTGTFSKAPRAWGFEDELRVVRGFDGCYLELNDGKEYLDWVCGLGTNLIGYSDHFARYMKGVLTDIRSPGFGLPHYIEDEAAKLVVNKIASRIPGWDKDDIAVRFAKTGSEATAMAVRLARAVTGKKVLAHSGYSGWFSEFISGASPAYGIPDHWKVDIKKFDVMDINPFFSDKTRMSRDNLAAIMFEYGVEDFKEGFPNFIRWFADGSKSLVIVDEVVTGLRYGLGGACERYNIRPDIVVLGKGLGNGYPISAVLAPKEYMSWFERNDPVFCSSTHWGEALSLNALKYVLSIYNFEDADVDYIWSIGEDLISGLRDVGYDVVGHPPRSLIVFDDERKKSFFIKEMRNRGILMNRPNFISCAHTSEHVSETVLAAKDVMFMIKNAPSEWLNSKPVFSLFSDR